MDPFCIHNQLQNWALNTKKSIKEATDAYIVYHENLRKSDNHENLKERVLFSSLNQLFHFLGYIFFSW